jgi:hypothetical protein
MANVVLCTKLQLVVHCTMRIRIIVNQCDDCGHQWIGKSEAKRSPSRKCRSTAWNTGGRLKPHPRYKRLVMDSLKPLNHRRLSEGAEDRPKKVSFGNSGFSGQEEAYELIEALTQVTTDLIESHQEDSNGGDADHSGEAPEAWSHCQDMAYARWVLTAFGVDVTPLRPEV